VTLEEHRSQRTASCQIFVPMIKHDIVNELVNRTGVTKIKAELAVDSVFGCMKRSLAKGDRIELRALTPLFSWLFDSCLWAFRHQISLMRFHSWVTLDGFRNDGCGNQKRDTYPNPAGNYLNPRHG
jgi:hypothetical protein